MSAKHTPGPWVAGRPDMGTIVDGVESKWIYSADDQYVAVASGRIKGEWNEVMANAQLISAAPDLLEALKELVNMSTEFESVDSQKIGFLDCRNRLRASVERSLAAIARAEGGQS